MSDYTTWHRWWAIWFALSFGSFLGVELYGLLTDPKRTLSAAIWSWEKFQPGQSIGAWTFFHLIFIGLLLLVDIWLLGHFGWGWWR